MELTACQFTSELLETENTLQIILLQLIYMLDFGYWREVETKIFLFDDQKPAGPGSAWVSSLTWWTSFCVRESLLVLLLFSSLSIISCAKNYRPNFMNSWRLQLCVWIHSYQLQCAAVTVCTLRISNFVLDFKTWLQGFSSIKSTDYVKAKEIL